jgi:hypothetical protein
MVNTASLSSEPGLPAPSTACTRIRFSAPGRLGTNQDQVPVFARLRASGRQLTPLSSESSIDTEMMPLSPVASSDAV